MSTPRSSVYIGFRELSGPKQGIIPLDTSIHCLDKAQHRMDQVRDARRRQFYSVSKKRQSLSTKTEEESQEVPEEILYIGFIT
jgi:hypothetical protein